MPAYRTQTHLPYAARQPAQSFQLADLLVLIRVRQSLILRIALCVIALAVLVALALPNVYSTTASIVLEQRKNSITDQASVISPLTIDPAMLQNQIQILSSRDLAAQVIGNLKLYDDPEFNPARGGSPVSVLLTAINPRSWFAVPKAPTLSSQQLMRDDIVSSFLSHVSISAEGLSTTLTVSFTSQDAEKAARIANAIADTYVANQVNSKVYAAQSTANWLDERVHDLSQQIQADEGAIQKYKTDNKLSDTNTSLAGISPVVDQQIAAINTQLIQAQADQAEKEAINAQVDSLVKAGNVADVSTVVSSPLISQLRSQQADLIQKGADVSARYGPLHPEYQAIEKQKRDLDTKIAQEAVRVASSASNEVMIARARVAALHASLGATTNQAGGQNMARVQLMAMEANADSTRKTYADYVARLRGAQNQDAIQNAEARVISRAPIPDSPAAPKRALIVGASIPAGFLLGILTALLLERFGFPTNVRGPQPMRNLATPAFTSASMRAAYSPPPAQPVYTGPPVIADIADAAAPNAADYILAYPQSAYTHAVANLARRFLGSVRFLAVATIEPGHVGGTLTVALARAAAAMGQKVLVIEADAHAIAGKAMRVSAQAGLADLLLSRVAFAGAIAKDPRSNVYVLSAAHAPKNVASMFASAQMHDLAQYLQETCDLVIVDAGAIAGGNALAVSRQMDAMLIAATPDALRRPSATQALGLASQGPAPGLVIIR